ncbi:MAG: TatD DNase family protein [Verrucomicrobia bacterium]|nr:MAG: TatD DNase family protein [Verrucomicrobiota bacterium]
MPSPFRRFYDAHCHLQDPRFGQDIGSIVDTCRAQGLVRLVVNGTRESDWDRVSALAAQYPDLVIPSYGLHPWWSRERSPTWLEDLEARLRADPRAGIGETGLDRWMEDPAPADQEDVLLAHLELAVRLHRPLSLHCLRAWGQLDAILRTHPRPTRGFLLHSYGGPPEMVRPLASLGAYFSFAGSFLHPSQAKKLAAFRLVPDDRLLIESDAPDQLLPSELDEFSLTDPQTGHRINHPGNVPAIHRHWPRADPALVESNFLRLFS